MYADQGEEDDYLGDGDRLTIYYNITILVSMDTITCVFGGR